MRVPHGHNDRAMPHELLNRSNIHPAHHGSTRERMAVGVPGAADNSRFFQGGLIDLHHKVPPLHRLGGPERARKEIGAMHPGGETANYPDGLLAQYNVPGPTGFGERDRKDGLLCVGAIPSGLKLFVQTQASF